MDPIRLRSLFGNVNGNTIVSIDTITDVKLTGGKKNPMQGRVRKVVLGSNVMVFTNKNSNGYENMVQRRLAKEGKSPESFSVGDRQWGEREEGTPFVHHNGEMYLEVIFLRPGKKHFEIDGAPVAAAEIEGMPAEREESEQGGLNNKVIIRTFRADSISAVTIDGHKYKA